MIQKYQVFVTVHNAHRYGKNFNDKTYLHGVPKKQNEFVDKQEAIRQAKDFWGKEINKIFVRKVIFHQMEEVKK